MSDLTIFDVYVVRAAVEAAVAANPEGVNPMDEDNSACLNRSLDPNATTPRCIASQVHFDLTGRELEGENSLPLYESLEETYANDGPFGGEAVALLSRVQRIFDYCSQRDETWTVALTTYKSSPGV